MTVYLFGIPLGIISFFRSTKSICSMRSGPDYHQHILQDTGTNLEDNIGGTQIGLYYALVTPGTTSKQTLTPRLSAKSTVFTTSSAIISRAAFAAPSDSHSLRICCSAQVLSTDHAISVSKGPADAASFSRTPLTISWNSPIPLEQASAVPTALKF